MEVRIHSRPARPDGLLLLLFLGLLGFLLAFVPAFRHGRFSLLERLYSLPFAGVRESR
jgi:hypothetical protein